MAKKFGKFLLFSAAAGAAAYGAYHYLQKKDQTAASTDKADENSEECNENLDEEAAPVKERSYVSLNLDRAEAFATGAFQKAKEVITDSAIKVKETVLETVASMEKAEAPKEDAPEETCAACEAAAKESAESCAACEATPEEAPAEEAADTEAAEESAEEAPAAEPCACACGGQASDDDAKADSVTEDFPLE